MAWPPNTTTTTKQNAKSSMYIEYSNLINELKQYMPQFNASVKDLQEPSQTFVTNFYTDVFSEFFCDVNNLIEIQVTQNLTYNDMYGEVVPILNMCTALKLFYSKLGIDDFGLNDICDPSSKRTYRLLQTMINFIKYSDEKIHESDVNMKAIRNMKETYDKLKKDRDILVNTINQKSLNRKQRGTELKTITDDVKIIKAEFMDISKYKEETLHELNKIKQEQLEIEKTCLKLSELKDNILKDITTLREQIVEAPDLLKADHERFKRMKNEITEKKSLMMAQVSAKKKIVLTLEEELIAQEKRLRLLTDVTEKNENLLKFVRDIESMLQNKSEIDESCEHLKEKIEFMERGRADINNQINYLVKEMERELNSFKSKYEALHKEKDNMVKEKSHHCETIKLLENEINKCRIRKNDIENEVVNIIKSFETIKDSFNKLQNDFCAENISRLLHNIHLLENDSN